MSVAAALLHDSVAARFRKFLSGFLKYFSETDAIIKLNHCFSVSLDFNPGVGEKLLYPACCGRRRQT
jgi:hypothetical protein